MVESRKGWIEKALARRKASSKTKAYVEGEKFLYLGKEYPLKIVSGYRRRLDFDEQSFYIAESNIIRAKKLFMDWYKEQAKEVLTERAKYYSGLMGLKFKKLTVRDTSSRWGSCSLAGNINFSYRLVLAPLEILDYVVVHELAHLEHHNHSKQFWMMVEKFAPNCFVKRKWLKDNAGALY